MPAVSPARPFRGRDLVCVRGERRVFAGLEFDLAPGGALLLAGPNGSGKSSLLRLMAGLSRPTAGALTWDGTPVAEDREAHGARLHYVGHADAIKPAFTAAENLAFWAGLAAGGRGRAARTETRTRIDAALAYFGLGGLAETPSRLLSAGQRRRLALARLLAAPAALWLLDEPTLALDAESFARLVHAIDDHCAAGGMAVCATHVDLGLASAGRLDLDAFAPADGGFADPFAATEAAEIAEAGPA